MKNQNDLIFSIVFGVLALIAAGIAYGTKQEVPSIPAPPVVTTADAKLPATSVVYGTALPNGGGNAGGGGASAFGGGGRGASPFGGSGRPGMMGPPAGFGAPGRGMSPSLNGAAKTGG